MTALLKATPAKLENDLNTLGFLFESLSNVTCAPTPKLSMANSTITKTIATAKSTP